MLKEKKIPRENKTIRIHPRAIIRLKKLSDKTGLTISELIREAIEQFILKYKGGVELIPRKENKLDEKRN